jgi:non-specific serine/threonine protein kinase
VSKLDRVSPSASEAPQAVAFGELLRRLRIGAGLSQADLAGRAGLGSSTVAALEQGTRRTHPRAATITLLADALGAGPGDRAALLAVATAPSISPPFAPAPLPSARRHRLPAEPTPLIGRESEVASVTALLRPGDRQSRLMTLVGPGGVGKTRLALGVGAELVDVYAHGAAFVDLAMVRDPRLVSVSIAHALQLRETAAGSAIHHLVLEYLSGMQLLLVIDNFEHLLPAAPMLSEMLESCARLSLLVTSRTALRLRSERRFLVRPLAAPAYKTQSLELVASSAAVRLFVERAQAVMPAFVLDASNAASVAAICRRLEGMPLAIELAAARADMLAPATLLQRLQDRLGLLRGGAPDLPERQRTLRAALAWSHNLLSEADRALFRRLSVFAGGWNLEAAEAICSSPELPTEQVLERLAALVDSSLVHRIVGGEDETRFAMLDTVREFAEALLNDAGEAEPIHRAHGLLYLHLAERAAPQLHGGQQSTWLRRLDREHDNLRAALDWLSGNSFDDETLRLATAATWYWLRRGYFADARRLTGLIATSDRCSPQVRAAAFLAAARVGSSLGDYGSMAEYDELALKLFRVLNDLPGMAEAVTDLGAARWQQGRLEVASKDLEEGLRRFRELDDPVGIATALLPLACAARDRGDFAAAEPLFQEALELRAASGDRLGIGHVLNNWAWLALYRGDGARAQRLAENALEIRRALGAQPSAGISVTVLARIALARGNRADAYARLMESLEIHREMGNRWGIALVLEGLADLTATTQPELALRFAAAAAARRAVIGRPMPPVEVETYARSLEQARALVSPGVASAEWRYGQIATDEELDLDVNRVKVSLVPAADRTA